ncbi:MAG: HNH endonuclease [Candidatus Dadabacteria bacterium]|nr:HNH endonuclease [Candidatus Dadabacteria bacterium]
MSYEAEQLQRYNMPSRKDMEESLLKAIFNNNGVIREFGSRESVVEELADEFHLSKEQRTAFLETVYRKENRVKKPNLWHRLLFRVANNLAERKFLSRPTQTLKLTNKKEWMLTEKGFDKVLKVMGMSVEHKEDLLVKSFEVETFARKLKKKSKPTNYNPIGGKKEAKQSQRLMKIRNRGFRQAVIEAYDYKCAVCGLKICSPASHQWEVEAAHIVPHGFNGKDDIWNGLSLCRFHHWSFDVGWYSFDEKFNLVVSGKLGDLPDDMGKIWNYGLLKQLSANKDGVQLPRQSKLWPDLNAVKWHRENVFGGCG